MTLERRIDELVAQHGSLRAVARVLEIDHGYLSRLRDGSKGEPSQDTLRKLGLRRIVSYERAWRPVKPHRSSQLNGEEMCQNCVTPWKCNGPHPL